MTRNKLTLEVVGIVLVWMVLLTAVIVSCEPRASAYDPYPPPRATPTNVPVPFPAEWFPEEVVYLPMVRGR